MTNQEKKAKFHSLAYHALIIIHALIVLYLIWVFVVASTNLMARLPTIKKLNFVFFSGYISTQLINRFSCPLTQWQNRLAARLKKKRIKTFTGHLLEKIGIRVNKTAIDIVSAVMIFAVILSYFFY